MTDQDASSYPQVAKLTVEDFLLLDRSGAFDAYCKTELVDGEILYVNAQHRPHARIKTRLALELAAALRGMDSGLEAIVEGSVFVSSHDAPEPDIVVTDAPEGEGLIPVASVELIVEVSDTTLAFDSKRKAVIYSSAGVCEYWIVDVNARLIQQMWRPTDGDYAERREVVFGDPMVSTTIAGLAVGTEGL